MSLTECVERCSSSKTDEAASTSQCMSECEKMTEKKTCIASCDDEQAVCLRDCDRDCLMDAMVPTLDTPHRACVEAHDECMAGCKQ